MFEKNDVVISAVKLAQRFLTFLTYIKDVNLESKLSLILLRD